MTSERSAVRSQVSPLPEFKRPPVVEVAISVMFDEILEFQPVHFGLFWKAVRDRYSKTEYHGPIGQTIELFDGSIGGNISFQFHSELPVGRCWYVNEPGTELLQLQPDRLTLNWRKLDTDAEYPRYRTLRARFEEELGHLSAFLEKERLGAIKAVQSEVIYINHIPQGFAWKDPSDIRNVVPLWSGETSDGFLPQPSGVRVSCQYLMGTAGQPKGRLHVELHEAIRKDKGRVLVLNLVGRGAPEGTDAASVLNFSDVAHEWIVRGFTSITSSRMHDHWERYDSNSKSGS